MRKTSGLYRSLAGMVAAVLLATSIPVFSFAEESQRMEETADENAIDGKSGEEAVSEGGNFENVNDINAGSAIAGDESAADESDFAEDIEGDAEGDSEAGQEHNLEYVDNEDGTHSAQCLDEDCDFIIENEEHIFTDGVCVCGATEPDLDDGNVKDKENITLQDTNENVYGRIYQTDDDKARWSKSTAPVHIDCYDTANIKKFRLHIFCITNNKTKEVDLPVSGESMQVDLLKQFSGIYYSEIGEYTHFVVEVYPVFADNTVADVSVLLRFTDDLVFEYDPNSVILEEGETVYENRDEVYEAIREAIRTRKTDDKDEFTIYVTYGMFSEGELDRILDSVYDRYGERDGMKPDEGDYMQYYVGQRTSRVFLGEKMVYHPGFNCTDKSGNYWYADRIVLNVNHITTYEEEQKVDAKVQSIISGPLSAAASSGSNEKKAKAAFDWIVANVSSSTGDRTDPIKHTAYNAFINGNATCQGYAVAYGRLLREMGVPNKVIMGTDANAHTYNIVLMDAEANGKQYYYYVDTSAGIFKKDYGSFSRTTEQAAYTTSDFVLNYTSKIKGYGSGDSVAEVLDSYGDSIFSAASLVLARGYVVNEIKSAGDEKPHFTIRLNKNATSVSKGELDFTNFADSKLEMEQYKDFIDWNYADYVSLDLNGHTLNVKSGMSYLIRVGEIKNGTIACAKGGKLYIAGPPADPNLEYDRRFKPEDFAGCICSNVTFKGVNSSEILGVYSNAMVDNSCSISGFKNLELSGRCCVEPSVSVNSTKINLSHAVLSDLVTGSLWCFNESYLTANNLKVNTKLETGAYFDIFVKNSIELRGSTNFFDTFGGGKAYGTVKISLLKTEEGNNTTIAKMSLSGNFNNQTREYIVNPDYPMAEVTGDVIPRKLSVEVISEDGSPATIPVDYVLGSVSGMKAYPAGVKSLCAVNSDNINNVIDINDSCRSNDKQRLVIEGTSLIYSDKFSVIPEKGNYKIGVSEDPSETANGAAVSFKADPYNNLYFYVKANPGYLIDKVTYSVGSSGQITANLISESRQKGNEYVVNQQDITGDVSIRVNLVQVVDLGKCTINAYFGSNSKPNVADYDKDAAYWGITAQRIEIKSGSKILQVKEGEDYTVSYESNYDSGTAYLVVEATETTKKLSGMKEQAFTINGIKISDGKSVYIYMPENKVIWEGEGTFCTPSEVRVYDISKASDKKTVGSDNWELLTENKDYKIVYTKNNVPGTATVTIVGIGGYDGSKDMKYTIRKPDFAKDSDEGFYRSYDNRIYISQADSREYNVTVHKPEITVLYNAEELIEGRDYTVKYGKNTDAGEGAGTVTITGKGNFTGSIKRTFNIAPRGLQSYHIKVSVPAGKYTGKDIKVKPVVTYVDDYDKVLKTLKEKTDYTLEYRNNRDVGKASGPNAPTVIITGKGNFCECVEEHFDIANNNIADAKAVTVDTKSNDAKAILNKTFIGEPVEFSESELNTLIKRTDGTSMTFGTDYEVVYSNNVNAGTASVTFVGIGDYYGSKKISFKIAKKTFDSLASLDSLGITFDGMYAGQASVKSSDISYDFTGNAIKPEVRIEDADLPNYVLCSGKDYSVGYSKNTNAGIATVTVTFKGNYAGVAKEKTNKLEKQFNILSWSLSDENTVVEIAEAQYSGGKEVKPAVVVKRPKVGCYGEYEIVSSKAYKTVYDKNTDKNVGDSMVTINPAKGDKDTNITGGGISCQYTIEKADLSKAVTSTFAPQIYKGKPIVPKFTVKCNGVTLKEGKDYTVTYTNNDRKGVAYFTVEAISGSNYTNSLEKSFIIK